MISAIVITLILIACFSGCLGVFSKVVKRNDKPEETDDPVGVMIRKDNKFTEEWLRNQRCKDYSITARDGIVLSGILVSSPSSANNLAILIHGHRTDLRMLGKYAAMYLDMGYDIFLADNRGHGKSGGAYTGMGWLERLDYQLWIDTLIKMRGPEVKIILHGISMGGATALMLSGEPNLPRQIKAIIEDCGYTSAYDEVAYGMNKKYVPAFPVLHLASAYTKLKAGYSFTEASALQAVARSSTPTFFIHGDSDDLTPVDMAYRLFKAASCPKELWIVPGTLHAMSYHNRPVDYRQKVSDFLTNYVR